MADFENIQAPQKLLPHHNVASFCSGVDSLDLWLKKRALTNEKKDVSRTYVVCVGDRVIGYYTLAAGSVQREIVAKNLQRNMPNPIPVMLLGRLAVDQDWVKRGIGKGMLRNAILQTLKAAEIVGMKAVLVHAISEEAQQFYERCGFSPSPIEPMTLMITIKAIKNSLEPFDAEGA